MNSFDVKLAERMHGMVDGEFDATPPVDRVLGRAHAVGRRRTAVRITGVSLAVLTAGAVVGGFATTPWASHPTVTAGPSTATQTSLLRLEAVVTASESVSYKIRVTNHSRSTPGAKDQVSTGAFDPATDSGYLRTPADDGPGFDEQRLVNGVLYLGGAGVDQVLYWKVQAGKHTGLDLVGAAASGLSATADPGTMVQILRKEGATVTQTDADTYHFAFEVSKVDLLPSSTSDKFSGDVKIGPDKRIASVTYDRLLQWKKPGVNRTEPLVDNLYTLEFSGYGTTVSVQAPTSHVTPPK